MAWTAARGSKFAPDLRSTAICCQSFDRFAARAANASPDSHRFQCRSGRRIPAVGTVAARTPPGLGRRFVDQATHQGEPRGFRRRAIMGSAERFAKSARPGLRGPGLATIRDVPRQSDHRLGPHRCRRLATC